MKYLLPLILALLASTPQIPGKTARVVVSDNRIVICRAELEKPVLPAGESIRTVVKITLDAARVPTDKKRPPINLAVVLDRSGSMSGSKIEHAKKAAIAALRRLDEGDIFSLIAYNNGVETVIPAQAAADADGMERRIREISSGGGTNLFGGVNQGASELRKHLSDRRYTPRIILLSDGLANVGPSSPDELGRLGAALVKEGISVTTVGVGNDYNEDLMTQLSQKSDGNTYFVENSNDLIFILDEHGQVLNASQATVRALGAEQLEPRPVAFSALVREDGRPLDWPAFWTCLSPPPGTDEGTTERRDWEALGVEGSMIELDAEATAAHLNDSPVAVVIARDITRRRALERDREDLAQQLIHSQRMEAVGQLAGGVAHDFNNMLHAIRGSLDRFRALKPGDRDGGNAMLSNIDQATERASSLTQQLLGFARKGKYTVASLPVAPLLEGVQSLFSPIAKKGVHLKLVVAPVQMIIRADETQLQQVLMNLLINARDAILEHGQTDGRIVLRAEPAADFTPGWQQRPDKAMDSAAYICIRVRDNGCGIPPELRQQIFEPFFTTKNVGKGTGMGLAMAYGCVVNHHGWIHLESEPGAGTEFFLFLPRQ